MKDTVPKGPIVLRPRLVERIWGETSLHNWYEQPAEGKPIGEVWLTAEECVAEGSGAKLLDLTTDFPKAFGADKDAGFPLLIKLLYPREKLSVQVHPNDAEARATLDQPRGKTECWYVLSAKPGAQVAIGFTAPLTPAGMRAAIADGTIEDKLNYIPVKAGDLVFVDAGTVHAIGPGMVVLETQQYSDVTYRLWDYGRPRELHLDSGLAVARSETSAGLVQPQRMNGFTRLVTCPYFTVDSFRSHDVEPHNLGADQGMQILIALGEGASVTSDGNTQNLQPGYATILPDTAMQYSLAVPSEVEVVRIFQPRTH